MLFWSGQPILADLVSITGVALAKNVLLSLSVATKLKAVATVVLLAGLITTTGVLAGHLMLAKDGMTIPTDATLQSGNAGLRQKPVLPSNGDLHGDPLPENALARLGTLRQRAPDSQIALSADGKEVIAISRNFVIRRFDASTGQLRSTSQLPVTNGCGWMLAFKPWELCSDFPVEHVRQVHTRSLGSGDSTGHKEIANGGQRAMLRELLS